MSSFGTVQIGRLTVREDRELSRTRDDDGSIVLSLTGQESSPNLTRAQLNQRASDLLSLQGMMVPVQFTEKPELNGYYTVDTIQVDQLTYPSDFYGAIPWQMKLVLIGSESEIDLQSRLGGSVTRMNDFSGTGERWHAPAVGALAYAAGTSTPPVVTRSGVDGSMPIYRNVAFGVNPRWACPVVNYGLGRSRFLSGGIERSGIAIPSDVTNWELNNGLVRVRPLTSGAVVEISAYTGGSWQPKTWNITAGGSSLVGGTYVSLLSNEYEMTIVRYLKALSSGRVSVDFILRRGSRFVELYIQSQTSTTLKVVRGTTEAGIAGANSAFVRASASDTAGNRYVVGSARTTTLDLVNGGLSKASAVVLDAYIGVEISSAPSGDLAMDLFNQYLGSPAESVQGVRR